MVDEDNDLKDTVQRLHRFVVDALRAKRDDPFGQPVTVAEIYQQLAPYRAVRTVLGFEMNADYEHALTRLLSGIDGLTRLDPAKARERLAKELDSPNPDVGMYREFAACDVVLNPSTSGADWVREQLEEPDLPVPPRRSTAPAPDWKGLAGLDPGAPALTDDRNGNETDDMSRADTGPVDDLLDEDDDLFEDDDLLDADDEPAEDDDVEDEIEDVEVVQEAAAPAPAPVPPKPEKTPEPKRAHASCIYCDSILPGSRNLRFCPFCGADQSMMPCASCGEAIEPGWAFCIACGTSVASAE